MDDPHARSPAKRRPLDPFRRALVRGLAVLLPPLLTVVILLWVWNTVAVYMLVPAENLARRGLITYYGRQVVPATAVEADEVVDDVALVDGEPYHATPSGDFIPAEVYGYVEDLYGPAQMPASTDDVLRAYIDRKWLPRHIVVPVFLCAFLLGLYLLGKFLAAGVGRFFWLQFERLIIRLPLVRNVYSSVKQVTDFVFSEREIEYTRVVAVEYPRKGIWQLAFVTGEALLDIGAAANEPMLTVFFPCSPMPFTGFTAVVKRSETLDLAISMEQAIQFMVSCGVVAPPPHLSEALAERERQVRPALPSAPDEGLATPHLPVGQ